MIRWNGEQVNVTRFPDNTTQVWKLNEEWLGDERVTLWWDYSHEGELIELAQIVDLLKATGTQQVCLNIDTLPFARQDKPVANDATFALHSFSRLLNAIGFEEIFIMDPHSAEALKLINRSRAIYPHGPLRRAWQATETNLACYPDNGATVKYSEIYSYLPSINGEKVRDQLTGHILSYRLCGDPQGKRVLIVDDICDGGRTFELLSQALYEAGAKEVNLFVSHGIFSKGLWPLYAAGINRIFTKDGEAFRMADGGVGYRA